MGDTITITCKGGFEKTNKFLERCLNVVKLGNLDRYGRRGVEALRAATPKDTGLAASQWSYQIHRTKDTVTLEWHNSDIEGGYHNVVLGVQLGHATRSGGWVEGIDFINPALRPIFDEIRNDLWREVTRH